VKSWFGVFVVISLDEAFFEILKISRDDRLARPAGEGQVEMQIMKGKQP
jgi:hypothetical protein